MKKELSLVLLFIAFMGFCQDIKLNGTWILDKVTFANGNALEINNNNYSFYSQYKFSNNKMEINGGEVPITITSKQIITPALKIDYEFQGKYLLLKNYDSDKITYLLKPEVFLELYPEFQPKEIKIEDKIVYQENLVIKPDFSYTGGFNKYFRDFFINYNNFPKNSSFFAVQFIVTKESKINDLKIQESISPDFDSKFIQYLKNGEKFLKNNTGKDILITRRQKISKLNDSKVDGNMSTEDRNIVKVYEKGNSFYLKNDFEKAIESYEKINALNLTDKDNEILRLLYINLGVSYLTKENISAACDSFNKAGGLTNFKSRNYVINFCSKK